MRAAVRRGPASTEGNTPMTCNISLPRAATWPRAASAQGAASARGNRVLALLVRGLGSALAGLFIFGAAVGATESPTAMRLGDAEAGALMIRSETPGRYLPAPMLMTRVSIDVGGMIARTRVSQRFHNPTDKWIEGVYVFPLPETAAVDRLKVRIGDRFIEGKIKKREEAKKIYERAKREGRKASLIEQERPNIFTSSVANIGPGEDVVVEIEYQQTIKYDGGLFALRFPMVVAPRYIPGAKMVVAFSGGGWGVGSQEVPDAGRITPPVRDPKMGKINPVEMRVSLDAGVKLALVRSPSHEIAVSHDGEGRRTIAFKAGAVPADKDFVLEWRPETGTAPAAGLFTETLDGATYAVLMLMPPTSKAKAAADMPREVVFVIDTSGSMAGASIAQAREALLFALDRLRPKDSFNVIQVNSVTDALVPAARAASRENLRRARAYVGGLGAQGGTEMAPALKLALDGRADESRIRQVIFLTDGAVGNEAALFGHIRARLADSRLFTVGIGSAPNSHFMTKAAELGRGTFTYIGSVARVKEQMKALFQKLESPVLTGIQITFPRGARAEAWPRIVPDLYLGEPVVVAARLTAARGKAVVTGRIGGKRWRAELPLAGGRAAKGVAALWARRKIAALMGSLHEGAKHETVKEEATQVALAHHLVSRYTSLVAVDVTPTRPKGEGVKTIQAPTNLPEGWVYDSVFGERQARPPVKPAMRKAMMRSARQFALAAAPAAHGAPGAAAAGAVLTTLPQGAAGAVLSLLVGFPALLLGLLLWFGRRRRPA